jgi:hypothetical protein
MGQLLALFPVLSLERVSLTLVQAIGVGWFFAHNNAESAQEAIRTHSIDDKAGGKHRCAY